MTPTHILAIAALTCGLPSTVLAEAPGTITAVVRVHRGAAISSGALRSLKSRIAEAALDVCGAPAGSLADVRTATRSSQCWKDAYAGATAQIGAPMLSSADKHEMGAP